ncbi:MAG: SDR family NAD(P)-dependent oxidoreductase [Pseudomonadales bacterium]
MKIAGIGIVVVGGASGLGLATAQLLREIGANVGVMDLEASASWDGPFVQADVTLEQEVASGFALLVQEIGPLRAVVNTAGIGSAALSVGTGASLEVAQFRRVLEVNALGTFIVAREAAEQMLQVGPDEDGERGVLVHTSSIVSLEGQVGTTAYAAGKGAINAMTLPLARELARFGIRVMTIAPGIFETRMFNRAPPPMLEWLHGQVQYPYRPGYPREYAAMARHIIENPMLNGDTLRLDGAYRVGPGSADHYETHA